MKSCASAATHASWMNCVRFSSGRIFCLPTNLLATFCAAVPWKRVGSCCTCLRLLRNQLVLKSAISWMSRIIYPAIGRYHRSNKPTMVDLPHPLGPTRAVVLPASLVPQDELDKRSSNCGFLFRPCKSQVVCHQGGVDQAAMACQ